MSLSASPVRVIVLLGFMGAGKTSVGKALASQLGWDFDDLDDRIQAREGLKIQQIFENSGEAAFRKIEHESLRDLLTEIGSSTRVVALGGGAYAEARQPDVARSVLYCMRFAGCASGRIVPPM